MTKLEFLEKFRAEKIDFIALCYNDRDRKKGTDIAKVSLIPLDDLEDEWLWDNLFGKSENFRRQTKHAVALNRYYRKEYDTPFSEIQRIEKEYNLAQKGDAAEINLFGENRVNKGLLDGYLIIDGTKYRVQCKSSYSEKGKGTSNSNRL